MGWSYRSDRSDEVYATTSGPTAVEGEQMPRPPSDGEDVDNVINPPELDNTLPPEGGAMNAEQARRKAEELKPKDPEAGPPPPPKLEGIPQEVIQEHKLGPAPAPSQEEQQKAIDAARGSGEKKTETKSQPQPAQAKK